LNILNTIILNTIEILFIETAKTMRTQKTNMIPVFLLLLFLGANFAIAQATNSTSTPLIGSPNSALCQFYKTQNLSAYQTPLIALTIIGGATIIGYEAFKRLSAEREEKEEGGEADLAKIMSRSMSIIILTGIIMAVIVVVLAMFPIALCGS